MRLICLGLFMMAFTGCQCCPRTDVYSCVIDDTSDLMTKADADCLYHPALDLNRIGKPDWCKCPVNRVLCCRCCKSACDSGCDSGCNGDRCTWTESEVCEKSSCTAGCAEGCTSGCADGCASESKPDPKSKPHMPSKPMDPTVPAATQHSLPDRFDTEPETFDMPQQQKVKQAERVPWPVTQPF